MAAIEITPARMSALLEAGFRAMGFAAETVGAIARHLVEAEARDVPSHGVTRLAFYKGQIDRGFLDPRAVPRVLRDDGRLIQVDGAGGLGIPAANLLLERLLAATQAGGVAAAGLQNCGHTGRMGAYAERAAEAGTILLALGGAAWRDWQNVVPYGSRDPLISTNPLTFGAPAGRQPPAVADFAVSEVPMGKIALAKAGGITLPEGSLLDKHGRPSSDPEDFYDGGAIRAFGGVKGSALAMVMELVTGGLLGRPKELHWLFLALRADAFRPQEAYDRDAEDLTAALGALRPAEGFEEVLMPGAREAHGAAAAATAGLKISEGVWAGLAEAMDSLGLSAADYLSVRDGED